MRRLAHRYRVLLRGDGFWSRPMKPRRARCWLEASPCAVGRAWTPFRKEKRAVVTAGRKGVPGPEAQAPKGSLRGLLTGKSPVHLPVSAGPGCQPVVFKRLPGGLQPPPHPGADHAPGGSPKAGRPLLVQCAGLAPVTHPLVMRSDLASL